MKGYIYIVGLCLLSAQPVWAQNKPENYSLSWSKELIINAVGGFFFMENQLAKRRMPPPFKFNEWQALDPQRDIRWAFDRKAINNWSPAFQSGSDMLLFGTMALAASGIFATSRGRQHYREVGVMALETTLLTVNLTNMTKHLTHRTRPYVYNSNADIRLKTTPDARRSFFSGHTALSAAAAFFSAQVLTDLYPDEKWLPWMWTGAATLPALTAWTRVRAGKHFPTDVLVGYGAGAVLGWAVPTLHRAQKNDTRPLALISLLGGALGMCILLVGI